MICGLRKIDNHGQDPIITVIDAQLGNCWLRFSKSRVIESGEFENLGEGVIERESFYDPTELIEQAIDFKRDFTESLLVYYGGNNGTH